MVQPHSNTAQRADRKNKRARFLSCFLVLATSLLPESIHAVGQDEQRLLEPGKPIEREVAGGESHSYRLSLSTGQYVKVVIDQGGLDMAVKLFAPDGKKAIEFDHQFNTGKFPLEWLAEDAGNYRLEVSVNQTLAKGRRYQVQVVELRSGTELDRNLQEARKQYVDYDRFYREEKYAEARQAAERQLAIIEKALGSQHPEFASALNCLAIACELTGDHQQGETLFQRALEIREKALGPRHIDVAQDLYYLAIHYDDIGDFRKAESFYERSLAIAENELGAENLIVAQILNDLGN
ncbi:MAG: tetratricopeptide repeat protein, partial [Blastocatellia bacterium]|nr:tetratricopeptide repeat protein [Blastocatellia bacterium]